MDIRSIANTKCGVKSAVSRRTRIGTNPNEQKGGLSQSTQDVEGDRGAKKEIKANVSRRRRARREGKEFMVLLIERFHAVHYVRSASS